MYKYSFVTRYQINSNPCKENKRVEYKEAWEKEKRSKKNTGSRENCRYHDGKNNNTKIFGSMKSHCKGTHLWYRDTHGNYPWYCMDETYIKARVSPLRYVKDYCMGNNMACGVISFLKEYVRRSVVHKLPSETFLQHD